MLKLSAVTSPVPPGITIRSFTPHDAEVCRHLYHEALIGGHLPANDTALDIDDIENAYMRLPGGHFWVAENERGEVVGMIGVQQMESSEGEIRRLRVRHDHRRRGIGSALLETAIRHCREWQHLKIKLDTFIEREPAIKLFEKLKFRLTRTREVGGKTLLYFYLDLYSSDRRPPPDKPS